MSEWEVMWLLSQMTLSRDKTSSLHSNTHFISVNIM